MVPVQEVAEDIPATELDNSSSSEEQPLPPAVDFSLTFSPKQWSHWIDMFSSESSQILKSSFCEEDDSPRTQQLKKAVQSQFFAKSLFPLEKTKGNGTTQRVQVHAFLDGLSGDDVTCVSTW